MSFDFLDDIHGNKSSKRLWAVRMLTIGLLSKVACNILALIIIPTLIYFLDINTETAKSYFDWAFSWSGVKISDPLIYMGGAILGWTILEHFGKKKK